MKTLRQFGLLMCIIFACFAISGCDSDEDQEETDYNTLIVGKWKASYAHEDSRWCYKSNRTGYKNFYWDNGASYYGEFVWTITGDQLSRVMLDDGRLETYTIDKLTSTILVLDGTTFTKAN